MPSSHRRTVRVMQEVNMDNDVISAVTPIPPKTTEKEKVNRRLPLDTWIQKMDKIMIDCLNKLEMFSASEWYLALQKVEKMKLGGVPYRSKNDENFKNALSEIDLLFSLKDEPDAFAESMLSFVRHYARSKRRKAMEEIAFVLTVIVIQPQLMMNETW